MEKLSKANRDQAHQIEKPPKNTSWLLNFLNEEAVTFGKLRVNNLTAILLCRVFALHNPMPAVALVVLISLRSILRQREKDDQEKKGKQE